MSTTLLRHIERNFYQLDIFLSFCPLVLCFQNLTNFFSLSP